MNITSKSYKRIRVFVIGGFSILGLFLMYLAYRYETNRSYIRKIDDTEWKIRALQSDSMHVWVPNYFTVSPDTLRANPKMKHILQELRFYRLQLDSLKNENQ